jgi:hypothetical protein
VPSPSPAYFMVKNTFAFTFHRHKFIAHHTIFHNRCHHHLSSSLPSSSMNTAHNATQTLCLVFAEVPRHGRGKWHHYAMCASFVHANHTYNENRNLLRYLRKYVSVFVCECGVCIYIYIYIYIYIEYLGARHHALVR